MEWLGYPIIMILSAISMVPLGVMQDHDKARSIGIIGLLIIFFIAMGYMITFEQLL